MVRVGCAPDLTLHRLQSFLGALYARDPHLHAEVVHLRSAAQLDALRAGALGLGLVHGAVNGDPAIETEPLFAGEPLAAFLPLGHRLAGAGALTPRDLAGEELVLFPRADDPGLHARLLELARACGFTFRDVREAGGADIRDALFAVAEGRGVGLAPRSITQVLWELGTILSAHPLEPEVRMPDTVLAWSAEAAPDLGAVVVGARAVARELYSWPPEG